jgi:hypothetical protein
MFCLGSIEYGNFRGSLLYQLMQRVECMHIQPQTQGTYLKLSHIALFAIENPAAILARQYHPFTGISRFHIQLPYTLNQLLSLNTQIVC